MKAETAQMSKANIVDLVRRGQISVSNIKDEKRGPKLQITTQGQKSASGIIEGGSH